MKKRLFLSVAFCVGALSFSFVQAQEISVERGVVWDQANNLQADIYKPATGTNLPVVLMVHGGGWSAGSRTDFGDFGPLFARQGWIAITIDYRLVSPAKGIRGDAPLADVRNAIKAIQVNATGLRADPKRIAVFGGSAGGHLAAMVATDPATPLRGAIIYSGPTDLAMPKATWKPNQLNMLNALLGENYSMDLARAASPLWRISPSIAPHWMLIHGDADDLVPLDQSRVFSKALKAKGIDTEYYEFAGEGHTLQKPDDQQRGVKAIVLFLTRIL
jgi:acetyl esterase/lipase